MLFGCGPCYQSEMSVVAASVSSMEPVLAMDTIDALDAAATLAAVEGELVARRAAEARDLALAAHWADLHARDPQLGPGGRRVWCGGDRLMQVGGDGTPEVQELSVVELSISRRVHPHAGRKVIADALDLRHRLPSWWAAVQDLWLEPWIARKAATMSRELDALLVRVVDAALPEDLGEVSPARILEVVLGKVIEADPARPATPPRWTPRSSAATSACRAPTSSGCVTSSPESGPATRSGSARCSTGPP